MEDLIPIIIIFVISSAVSSMKKKQQRQAAETKRWSAASVRVNAPQVRAKPAEKPAPVKPVPPVQVMQPTVHTHLQPDCETHDAPGSLNYTSTEGKDPCHETQLTYDRSVDAEAPREGGLTFDWTGDSMVKAIVMQEVLNRPVRRAR